MKTKNTQSVENQALALIKSLEKTIDDCKNYSVRNQKQFEKVKEYMKIKHPELFLNEFDNHNSIVMEFSMKKSDEEKLAYNIKKAMMYAIKNTNLTFSNMFN
jgi:hypothetical protein